MNKPFDLAAAKNGAKVVNERGMPVEIFFFEKETPDGFVCMSYRGDQRQANHTADGRIKSTLKGYDLFMAPTTTTWYRNTWIDSGVLKSFWYTDEVTAKKTANFIVYRKIEVAVPVEIED